MACGGCNKDPNIVKISKNTAPLIDDDGSIVFPEDIEPFDIEGYEKDPNDDQRILCTEPPCLFRVTGILLDQDDTYKPYMVCGNDHCEHSSKPVTFKICRDCPLRLANY